jgi:hypothetical protein
MEVAIATPPIESNDFTGRRWRFRTIIREGCENHGSSSQLRRYRPGFAGCIATAGDSPADFNTENSVPTPAAARLTPNATATMLPAIR